MRATSVFLVLFFAATLAAGAVFWANTSEENWWVGVQEPDGKLVPKFKLAWYEQLMVAGFVGMKYGIISTLAAYLLFQIWLFVRGRS